MSHVTLDNEPVTFDGATPSGYDQVMQLLSTALEEQERCIVSFTVDGCDILEGKTPNTESFTSIDAISSLQAEVFIQLIEQFLEQSKELLHELETFSINVLHHPWSTIKSNTEVFSNKIIPTANLLEIIIDYAKKRTPTWNADFQQLFNSFEESISQFADQIEQNDITGLSDTVAFKITPSASDILDALQTKLLPFFQKKLQAS